MAYILVLRTSPAVDQSGMAAGVSRNFTLTLPILTRRPSSGQLWPRR